MRVALIQLNSSDTPAENLAITSDHIRKAAAQGARLILTPEVTNCVSASRTHQNTVLTTEAHDITLAALTGLCAELGVWLIIGSLALKLEDEDRFANRSFLVSPQGRVAARYDKMHMFDVTLSDTETYRESAGYRPGEQAVLARVDDTPVGLTICYDVRFPYLYRNLAQAGACILTVPSAFSPDTGPDHWGPLLQARAIENGCFVLAPAQTGTHRVTRGRPRKTWGHSLAIDPWGRILANAGVEPGVTIVDLDLSQVDGVRQRLPSLTHDRSYRKVQFERG
jgi:predicted amidohydrolase